MAFLLAGAAALGERVIWFNADSIPSMLVAKDYGDRYSANKHRMFKLACETRGGGPMLTEKLLRLLLEKQVVRGSTGAITMLDGAISFFPNGSDRASACRPLTYEKKHR